MKSITKLLLVGLATLLLAACSAENRSTEWYVQNSLEQGIQMEECKNKPETSKTTNCINANEAELVIQQGSEAIEKYLADHNLKNPYTGK